MSATPVESLSGSECVDLFAAATAWLERNVPQVNAVNVFPVPDGDTGTNMFTDDALNRWRRRSGLATTTAGGSARGHVPRCAYGRPREFRRYSLADHRWPFAGRGTMPTSLTLSSSPPASSAPRPRRTRRSQTPTEGTILTVIRDVSDCRERLPIGDGDMTVLIETAVNEARESVDGRPRCCRCSPKQASLTPAALGSACYSKACCAICAAKRSMNRHWSPQTRRARTGSRPPARATRPGTRSTDTAPRS